MTTWPPLPIWPMWPTSDRSSPRSGIGRGRCCQQGCPGRENDLLPMQLRPTMASDDGDEANEADEATDDWC